MIEKKKEHSRARKYLLTINNPDKHNLSHDIIIQTIKESKIAVRYFAICDETGANGTYHYHIFLYFRNAIEFTTLKSMWPTANIQTAQGTAMQCKSYLLKNHKDHCKDANGFYSYKDSSGKIHEGQNHTDTFEEFGELPEDKQGKRTDLEYIYNLVKEGLTDIEIIEQCGDVAIKYLDKIGRLRQTYLISKYRDITRTNLKVNYIFGTTGAGKTSGVLKECRDNNWTYFRVTNYDHPYDGYACEYAIIYDEYYGQLPLNSMLDALDIHATELNARYQSKTACYEVVYIISNVCFEDIYSEVQKDPKQAEKYSAWVRRFTGWVKEYTSNGINFYPTMQEYLNRFKKLPDGVKTPFDTDGDSEPVPFDD